jgi:hypothetical protein
MDYSLSSISFRRLYGEFIEVSPTGTHLHGLPSVPTYIAGVFAAKVDLTIIEWEHVL